MLDHMRQLVRLIHSAASDRATLAELLSMIGDRCSHRKARDLFDTTPSTPTTIDWRQPNSRMDAAPASPESAFRPDCVRKGGPIRFGRISTFMDTLLGKLMPSLREVSGRIVGGEISFRLRSLVSACG